MYRTESTMIRFFICLCLFEPSLTTLNVGKIPAASLGYNTYLNGSEKSMPIGPTTFVDLVSKGLFVDKTLFVNNILKNTSRHSIIVCPRKWGKSVNLNMLKTFVEIQVHPNGSRIIPISDTPNYQLFIEGRYEHGNYSVKLANILLISSNNYRRTIGEYLGRYPVIYMSFNGICDSGVNITTKLSQIIAKAFDDHKYMLEKYNKILKSEAIVATNSERVKSVSLKFTTYLNAETVCPKELELSIPFLLEQLHDHFKDRKVFVLIDDYGHIYKNGDTPVVVKTLIANILISSYLKHAVFTADQRTPIEKDELIDPFVIRTYYPFHGFLKREMDLVFNHFEMKAKERRRIRYWYGGYGVIPKYEEDRVCNPWSTINYLSTREFKPYWTGEGFHDHNVTDIFQTHSLQYILSRLISGRTYEHVIVQQQVDKFLNETLNYLYLSEYTSKNIARTSSTRMVHHYSITNFEISYTFQSMFAASLPKIFDDIELLKLFNKTAAVWETFLSTKDPLCPELQNLMQQCAGVLPLYLEKETYNSLDDGLDALRRVVVLSTVLSKGLKFINYLFAYDDTNGVDEIAMEPEFVLTSQDRGFIVDIKLGNDTDTIQNRTIHYYRKFEQYPTLHNWQDVKVIFIGLMPDSGVDIFSFMHPIYAGVSQT